MSNNSFRFEEIISEIKDLLQEAIALVPDHARDRAETHWYAQISMALDEDHYYMGGCMCSMQDTLGEIDDFDDEEEEEIEDIEMREKLTGMET